MDILISMLTFHQKNFIGWSFGFWKKIGEIIIFFNFFQFFTMNSIFLVDLWMNKLIQGVQTHNGPFKNARNDKQTKKNYQIFLLYFHFISFDSDIWFFNNDSWIKSMLRVHTLINRPKKGISKENIGKIFENFL